MSYPGSHGINEEFVINVGWEIMGENLVRKSGCRPQYNIKINIGEI
jgi:hypothetical protein